MNDWLTWIGITLFCIAIQGFYSMMEMAALSFNRVRLQYYVSKGVKRAIWLQRLLQKPSRLFGTIMLGVNIALQVGSQSSREVYRALNLDPDLAPITQVFLVVIFAELAPLIAARRFSEQVVMWGIPIVYATHRLFAPLIWIIGLIMRLFHRLIGSQDEAFDIFLSRDELQIVLESHEEEDEFNIVVSNIFGLKNKVASQVMIPLSKIETLRADTSVEELRRKVASTKQPYLPLFHKTRANIVSIAIARDFVRLSDADLIREHARPPWFITASTKLMQILSQFRKNTQSVAVVLDPNGSAVGILTLDAILEEIFGDHSHTFERAQGLSYPLIQRTFSGNTPISEFNQEYGTHLESHGVETLAQLMITLLDHPPEPGDTVIVDPFELTVEETTLLGIKSVSIMTLET